MASSTFTSLLFFLLITIAIANANAFIINVSERNITRMRFYIHEHASDAYTIPAIHTNDTKYSSFGDIAVFDCDLRDGPDSTSSRLIGRAQGFDATMKDDSVMICMNFAFSVDPLTGSTLSFMERFNKTFDIAERAVIGGTGKFRGAKGYAVNKFVNGVAEFDVYVKCDFDFNEQE